MPRAGHTFSPMPYNIQEYNTDPFETHHGVLIDTARQTNGKNETFDRDYGRRIAEAQTLQQMASVSRSHQALIMKELMASNIRKDGIFLKMSPQMDTTTKIERPLSLSQVSAAQRTITGGPHHARLFIVVCYMYTAGSAWSHRVWESAGRRA